MSTIPVVVETESQPVAGTLGLERAGPVGRIVDIDVETLRAAISGLTEKVGSLFTDVKAVGGYQLKEIQIGLEINTEGGVALIGSLKAGAKAAISLKFTP